MSSKSKKIVIVVVSIIAIAIVVPLILQNIGYKYVKRYKITADKGAIISWYDPETGEFKMKFKCENCGRVYDDEIECDLSLFGDKDYFKSSIRCENPYCPRIEYWIQYEEYETWVNPNNENS